MNSPSVIDPAMTNRPPTTRIVSVATLVQNMMTGISHAKRRRIRRLMSRALVLAARNRSYS